MNADVKIIRGLAKEWSALASQSIMSERAALWTALHDLKPVRPPVIIETELMGDFITAAELKCCNPDLRAVEYNLRHGIKHVNLFGDDYILANSYPVQYSLIYENGDYGVSLQYITNPATRAITTNHPVKELSDVKKIKRKKVRVDVEASNARKKTLDELFDGALPVVFSSGYYNLPGLTKYLYDLIGMDNIYEWLIDEPNAIADIINLLKDDYTAYVKYLEHNNLLTPNNKNQMAGSGSYGYVSGLYSSGSVKLKNQWVWLESQESATISPAMFTEAFLPAMSEIAKLYGLVYYGCCEQLHDRFAYIEKAIPNIRSVSVSPWSDAEKMSGLLKNKYVFSKKLSPQFISDDVPNIKAQEKEITDTLKAAGGSPLEFIYRDVYEYKNNPKKFQDWIAVVKNNTKLQLNLNPDKICQMSKNLIV